MQHCISRQTLENMLQLHHIYNASVIAACDHQGMLLWQSKIIQKILFSQVISFKGVEGYLMITMLRRIPWRGGPSWTVAFQIAGGESND